MALFYTSDISTLDYNTIPTFGNDMPILIIDKIYKEVATKQINSVKQKMENSKLFHINCINKKV